VFETDLRAAVGHERDGVMEMTVVHPRQTDNEPGSTRALASQFFEGASRGAHERRSQHQIFWWIPDDRELGEHDEIGAMSASEIASASDPVRVARDVANDRIDLSGGYRERSSNGHSNRT